MRASNISLKGPGTLMTMLYHTIICLFCPYVCSAYAMSFTDRSLPNLSWRSGTGTNVINILIHCAHYLLTSLKYPTSICLRLSDVPFLRALWYGKCPRSFNIWALQYNGTFSTCFEHIPNLNIAFTRLIPT